MYITIIWIFCSIHTCVTKNNVRYRESKQDDLTLTFSFREPGSKLVNSSAAQELNIFYIIPLFVDIVIEALITFLKSNIYIENFTYLFKTVLLWEKGRLSGSIMLYKPNCDRTWFKNTFGTVKKGSCWSKSKVKIKEFIYRIFSKNYCSITIQITEVCLFTSWCCHHFLNIFHIFSKWNLLWSVLRQTWLSILGYDVNSEA